MRVGYAASSSSMEIAFAFFRISLWLYIVGPYGLAIVDKEPAASCKGPTSLLRRTTSLQLLQSSDPNFPSSRSKVSELLAAGLGADAFSRRSIHKGCHSALALLCFALLCFASDQGLLRLLEKLLRSLSVRIVSFTQCCYITGYCLLLRKDKMETPSVHAGSSFTEYLSNNP
jgi:hypothetical protein